MDDFTVQLTTPVDMPDTMIITMGGSMTIQYGNEIMKGLLDAFASASTIVLDLEQVTQIDLVGLQLICSGHRSATADGKQLTIKGADSAVIQTMANVAGYLRHVGCDMDAEHKCIWVPREEE